MPPRVQWVACQNRGVIAPGHHGTAARHKVGTRAYYVCAQMTGQRQAAARADLARQRAEARRMAQQRAAIAKTQRAARRGARRTRRRQAKRDRQIRRAQKYCGRVLGWNERFSGRVDDALSYSNKLAIEAIAAFAADPSSGLGDLLAEKGDEAAQAAAREWARAKKLGAHALCVFLKEGATAIRNGVKVLREGMHAVVNGAVPGDNWAAKGIRLGLHVGVDFVVHILSTKPLAFAFACQAAGALICPDNGKCTCGEQDTIGIMGSYLGHGMWAVLNPR